MPLSLHCAQKELSIFCSRKGLQTLEIELIVLKAKQSFVQACANADLRGHAPRALTAPFLSGSSWFLVLMACCCLLWGKTKHRTSGKHWSKRTTGSQGMKFSNRTLPAQEFLPPEHPWLHLPLIHEPEGHFLDVLQSPVQFVCAYECWRLAHKCRLVSWQVHLQVACGILWHHTTYIN